MTEPDTAFSLDDEVRRADTDRWLASRFIGDAVARADVVTLYAFNHVLAGVAAAVSEPMMGQIRLAWWREAIEEMTGAGPVRAHPIAEALAEPVRAGRLDAAALEALVDAREADLNPGRLSDEAAIDAYIDATAGALAALAARRLDAGAEEGMVRSAMRAWGWTGLMRNRALPVEWTPERVGARVAADLAAARSELAALPVTAFPAVAYCTLSRVYVKGRQPGDLEKRLRLTWATASGRV